MTKKWVNPFLNHNLHRKKDFPRQTPSIMEAVSYHIHILTTGRHRFISTLLTIYFISVLKHDKTTMQCSPSLCYPEASVWRPQRLSHQTNVNRKDPDMQYDTVVANSSTPWATKRSDIKTTSKPEPFCSVKAAIYRRCTVSTNKHF